MELSATERALLSVLNSAHLAGEISVHSSVLAQSLGLPPSSLGQLLQKMTELGLLDRLEEPGEASLSAKGFALARGLARTSEEAPSADAAEEPPSSDLKLIGQLREAQRHLAEALTLLNVPQGDAEALRLALSVLLNHPQSEAVLLRAINISRAKQ